MAKTSNKKTTPAKDKIKTKKPLKKAAPEKTVKAMKAKSKEVTKAPPKKAETPKIKKSVTTKNPQKTKSVVKSTKVADDIAPAANPQILKPQKIKPPKATKVAKTRGRKKSSEPMAFELSDIGTLNRADLNDDQKKWLDLYEKYRKVEPLAYKPQDVYTPKTPLFHSLFGWGYILTTDYDRLDVLFKDGKRLLISNRKI